MAVELPLFPLGTVLFPHMPLPLHIFEERYRRMLRDCDAEGTGFGVIAIREGHEVGSAATPYEVGTLALIREREQLPDGRSAMLVVGASRFRVLAVRHDRPYLTGSVQYLEDRPATPDDAEPLATTLRARFRRYLSAQRAGESARELELPDDPELLAYLVAASLRVDVAQRQRLLEMDSTTDRLHACITLLRQEQSLVAHLLQRQEHAGSVSLN